MTDEELRQEFAELKDQILRTRNLVLEVILLVDPMTEDQAEIQVILDGVLDSIKRLERIAVVHTVTRSVTAMEARDDARDSKIAELEERIRKLEGAA